MHYYNIYLYIYISLHTLKIIISLKNVYIIYLDSFKQHCKFEFFSMYIKYELAFCERV